MGTRKKVLVTGLAGKIGGIIRKNLSQKYLISGLDLQEVNGYDTTVANLSDLKDIISAFEGIRSEEHTSEPSHW